MTLPNPAACCFDPCEEPTSTMIPGPSGEDGAAGEDGAPGQSAFSPLTAAFTMPAELAEDVAEVENSEFVSLNGIYFLNGSSFQVTDIPSALEVTLKNLKDTATSKYLTNADPATIFAIGVKLTPAGVQGAPGAAAGGGLLVDNNLSDLENVAEALSNLGISNLLPTSGAGPPTVDTTGLIYIDTTGDGTNADVWFKVSGTWKGPALQIPA